MTEGPERPMLVLEDVALYMATHEEKVVVQNPYVCTLLAPAEITFLITTVQHTVYIPVPV